jgi:DNA-binding response OmpR family regulator
VRVAARQGSPLEHTTLAGFSILVIERDADAKHYLCRTLEGAGADVFAPSDCEDAFDITDELELSAAVLDYSASRASSHLVAMRLTSLDTPFVLCADAGQTCAAFAAPVLYRPIVGTTLIAVLRSLLQRPLDLVTDAGHRLRTSSRANEFERPGE